MKTTVSRVVATGVFALIACRSASAQQVHTTNLVTESKERVLRIEAIIPARPKAVWNVFATEEGLKKWVAPVVALDLRIGGTLSTHYDKTASIGSPGTIRLGIVNYLERELMTYKVNLTQLVQGEGAGRRPESAGDCPDRAVDQRNDEGDFLDGRLGNRHGMG